MAHRIILAAIGATVCLSAVAIGRGVHIAYYPHFTEVEALLRLWPFWALALGGAFLLWAATLYGKH